MMAMTTRTRWLILSSLLTATLVAVVWVDEQAGETDVPAVEAKTTKSAGEAQHARKMSLALEKLQRTAKEEETEIQDVFKSKSWFVPPPPPKPTPPPPPAPPPLPFKYFGKLEEAGQLTVFVTKQDRNYALKAGDSIDGAYRVERVDAKGVTFTYLPLNMQQTLAIGGVQ